MSNITRPERLSLGNKVQETAIKWNNSQKHPVIGFIGARVYAVTCKPAARIVDVTLHIIFGIGKVLIGATITAPISFIAFLIRGKGIDTNWTVKQGVYHFGYATLYTVDIFVSPTVNLISPNIYPAKKIMDLQKQLLNRPIQQDMQDLLQQAEQRRLADLQAARDQAAQALAAAQNASEQRRLADLQAANDIAAQNLADAQNASEQRRLADLQAANDLAAQDLANAQNASEQQRIEAVNAVRLEEQQLRNQQIQVIQEQAANAQNASEQQRIEAVNQARLEEQEIRNQQIQVIQEQAAQNLANAQNASEQQRIEAVNQARLEEQQLRNLQIQVIQEQAAQNLANVQNASEQQRIEAVNAVRVEEQQLRNQQIQVIQEQAAQNLANAQNASNQQQDNAINEARLEEQQKFANEREALINNHKDQIDSLKQLHEKNIIDLTNKLKEEFNEAFKKARLEESRKNFTNHLGDRFNKIKGVLNTSDSEDDIDDASDLGFNLDDVYDNLEKKEEPEELSQIKPEEVDAFSNELNNSFELFKVIQPIPIAPPPPEQKENISLNINVEANNSNLKSNINQAEKKLKSYNRPYVWKLEPSQEEKNNYGWCHNQILAVNVAGEIIKASQIVLETHANNSNLSSMDMSPILESLKKLKDESGQSSFETNAMLNSMFEPLKLKQAKTPEELVYKLQCLCNEKRLQLGRTFAYLEELRDNLKSSAAYKMYEVAKNKEKDTEADDGLSDSEWDS